MIKGEKFIAGNSVRLISDGPLMTVESWDGQRLQYRCIWFDGPVLRSGYFNEELLKFSSNRIGFGMEAGVI